MEAASPTRDSSPPTSPRFSPSPSPTPEQRQQPDGEWRAILPNLLTKTDFEALSDRLGRVVREEVAQLRADLSNVEARMSVAEAETRALRTDLEQTNTAVTTQEADIAHLTTWVDDLDNRGRRMNLRVRGVREGGPAENIPELLRQIFSQVLGNQNMPRLGLVRAHRALRPIPPPEDQPRDIVCCLDNFQLKEEILRTARRIGNIRMDDQTITIYQDLSRYTLQARRALRPITTALQHAGIQYRWGYPFSLSARHGPDFLTIRKPDDVHAFMRTLGLPPVTVPNWLARSFLLQPNRPQQPQGHGPNQRRPQPQRHRDGLPGRAGREM
ncbi:Hypothetical predicted protein [Pelobates cultripes]|uniref:L1 transposable element RRM domain-containing protein n=1 Tax=Pelobates cultripes TaxID=61616 RepID=A0AAD1W265_PELCU|nr:Hypothetical predicted protein [Pelobates cultripes]